MCFLELQPQSKTYWFLLSQLKVLETQISRLNQFFSFTEILNFAQFRLFCFDLLLSLFSFVLLACFAEILTLEAQMMRNSSFVKISEVTSVIPARARVLVFA